MKELKIQVKTSKNEKICSYESTQIVFKHGKQKRKWQGGKKKKEWQGGKKKE